MHWPTEKLGGIHSQLFRENLKVPYISQINENACGAAVLAMIYKYYGLENVSQEVLFEKYRVPEPHGSGNFRFDTDSLVSDALGRGFLAFWDRADYRNHDGVTELLQRLTRSKIPIVVCQKFTDEQPEIGHFRIVIGARNGVIYMHDPHPEIGGANREWSIEQFLEYWQPTGQNVTGGVFVVIKKL